MAGNEIKEYIFQLSAVEEALKTATGEQVTDLLYLKSKLQEVVSLLQAPEDGSSAEKETTPVSVADDLDDEFALFQREISKLDQKSSGSNENDVDSDENTTPQADQELEQVLSSLEGSKCRAPFSREWGEFGYHNAMIISTDCDPEDLKSLDEVMVKVMFCNPVCEEMKPCAFFLNGHCKFSDDKCRFSHGHEVKFSELKEFALPDFNSLKVDSYCLAKGSDDIWHKATVEKLETDQKYLVKIEQTGKMHTLDTVDILPLITGSCTYRESNCEEIEDINSGESSCYLNFETKFPTSGEAYNEPVGSWGQHTNGIGSKLMMKMGHIWGQGLGKNSDGRLHPIEAVILPIGKSLDKCIEMRETCNPKGPVALETRVGLDQDREKQRAKKAKADVQPQEDTVFDFLNSRISSVSSDGQSLSVRKNRKLLHEEPTLRKNLNLQVFSVGEDIRRAKRELVKLQQTLSRNTKRNDVVCSQVERKIAAQTEVLRNLQAKERKINADIKSQTSHKKLTIF